MDVMDIFVITELDVYLIVLCVMDIHHAVMNLMKGIVVREISHTYVCIGDSMVHT